MVGVGGGAILAPPGEAQVTGSNHAVTLGLEGDQQGTDKVQRLRKMWKPQMEGLTVITSLHSCQSSVTL